jgi:hypothetical protein
MLNKNSIVNETREFFDLKKRLKLELENLEKKVYSEKEVFSKVSRTFDSLKEITIKTNSNYFKLKLETLENLLNKLLEKRKYKKIEFDRIFKTLEKIQENETVEFLDLALKSRIEKISEKIVYTNQQVQKKENQSYYLFSFNNLFYLCRFYPTKFIYEADSSKQFVRIKNERYPIFPIYTNSNKSSLEYSNILILKLPSSYKCFRYDKLEKIDDLNTDELKSRLIDLDIQMGDLKSYLRYKGKRVHYLDI